MSTLEVAGSLASPHPLSRLPRLPLACFLVIRPFILQEFSCHFLRREKVFSKARAGVFI